MNSRLILICACMLLLAGCQKEKITKTGIIKDHFYLQNGDAKMPVYLEGNISSDKILIVVHGGPGDGSLYYNTDEATDIAESEFAIAYWDQRLAGITQGNRQDVEIGNYLNDLRKLIILLRSKYGESKKIYLMGHSWGGLLVPLFIEEGNNQSMIDGWIQVDGEHNYAMSDSLSRRNLIDFGSAEISAGRHTSEWQNIIDYCNGHDSKGDYDIARNINELAHDAESLISERNAGRSTTESAKFFIRKYRYPITTYLSNGIYNNYIGKIDEQAYEQQANSRLSVITVPTLLLWGKYDFVCPPQLGTDLQNHISSTDVSLNIFNNSGHSPMFNEPVLFWSRVRDWVKAH
jgi:pimeloyl-ACP methyl ester carboxylesterase